MPRGNKIVIWDITFITKRVLRNGIRNKVQNRKSGLEVKFWDTELECLVEGTRHKRPTDDQK